MNIVSRADCELVAPKGELYRMRFPVGAVWLHHTVTGSTADPCADWRGVQEVGFDRGFSDVSYSWGAHPNGTVLEGRGDHIGAHTAGRNSTSLGIALIGNYDKRVVFPEQVTAVRELIGWLIETGRLKPGVYPTGGHRQAPGAATACPGEFGMEALEAMRVPWEEVVVPEPVPAEPTGVVRVNRPVVATVADPQGRGYWQVTDDGGVFSFPAEGKDLPFFGSMGGTRLNQPIVDMVVRPQGDGYWMVAADGGVFNFGAALFWGGRGAEEEAAPTVGIEVTADGEGYWLTTADGGLFAYGSAFWAGRADYRR